VRKLGRGLLAFDLPGGASGGSVMPAPRPAATRVRQGYLEEPNVNAVGELVSMIAALRAFEASQRSLQANDQTLDKAINEIGRV
jgi:flagellar basal-body rod protein FlgG